MGLTDVGMPVFNGTMAGDNGNFGTIDVLNKLREIADVLRCEACKPQI
jgi:hypothetical protein